MAVTPPSGYGVFAVTFNIAGVSNDLVNTWGFRNVAAGTAAAARTALHNAFATGGGIYIPAFYNTDMTRVQEYVLLNTAGSLTAAVDTTTAVGTSTFDAPPRNVSGVVLKRTALAGRQFRGRVALPNCFIDEGDVDANGIIGSSINAYRTALTLTLGIALASGYPLYLLHGPDLLGVTPVPTPINALDYDSMVGTQRRRLRR